MNLTNTQRVIKLCMNLCLNPSYVLPYLKHSIVFKTTPLKLGLPWWSYKSIDKTLSFINPEMKVFEWGSGGSTLFFARRVKYVNSVEDDPLWLDQLQSKLKQEGINNVKISYCPFDFRNPKNFPESAYLNALSSNEYDIIIIDGQDCTFQERITCFQHAEKYSDNSKYIIMDDFWRYETLLTNNRALKTEVLESVGPCRLGVTNTAIFYY